MIGKKEFHLSHAAAQRRSRPKRGSVSSTTKNLQNPPNTPTGEAMSKFIKPALLSLGLVAGLALTAQAQTVPGPNVATLPPTDQGPRPSSHLSIPGPAQGNVTASPAYVG